MAIFFTSDLHIGHAMVAGLRGFDSINKHDYTIINNINKMVMPNDTLYVLGDVVMGGWRTNAHRIKDIMANVHVVLGNHDRPAPNNSNGHDYVDEFMDRTGAKSAVTMAKISHNGIGFMLSHYPYDNAPGEVPNINEYDEFRLRDTGKVLLHGHTHSNEKVSFSTKGTMQIHVGVDAWGFKPVSWGQIKTVMEENNA